MVSDDRSSWRERDLKKDRSVKHERRKSSMELRAEKMASTQAKKDLEKLFSGSKLSKAKTSKLDQIRSLRGKPDFYKAIQDYVDEFGIPLEWEAQMLVLDHRDTDLVIRMLEELLNSGPKKKLEEQKLLVQKLKVMEISTFDSKLVDKIKELKKALLVPA